MEMEMEAFLAVQKSEDKSFFFLVHDNDMLAAVQQPDLEHNADILFFSLHYCFLKPRQ